MNLQAKILTPSQLGPWRERWRQAGKKLVVTNGCFDILHVGHVTYLEAARNLGDGLLVGLTSDSGVRALKGAGRPINPELNRAAVLAALESVNAVFVFPETTALEFLAAVQPDIYVKGGDYTLETINQDERRLIQKMHGRIVILPGVPGQSTSALLEKLR